VLNVAGTLDGPLNNQGGTINVSGALSGVLHGSKKSTCPSCPPRVSATGKRHPTYAATLFAPTPIATYTCIAAFSRTRSATHM
jgi:hypothetical protein